MKRIMQSLKQFYTDLYLQLNAVKIALITGSMTLLVPVSASAQEGLGETVKNAVEELSTGAAVAIKIGSAAVGIGMVAYSIWGLSMGRKKDEREFPIGSTLVVGIAGAVFLGLLFYAGILSTSFFGESNANQGIELVDTEWNG